MTGETGTGAKQTLGIIGLGAFGKFMAKHLCGYFTVKGCDTTTGF